MLSKSTFTLALSRPLPLGISAAALAMCMQTAHAADPQPVVTKPDFARLDSNGDGFIDKNEAATSLEVSGWLITGDGNKDGRLSREEFRATQSSLGIPAK